MLAPEASTYKVGDLNSWRSWLRRKGLLNFSVVNLGTACTVSSDFRLTFD
jgi:hypothetical protein